MDFGALPPEVNSGRIYSGPGSAPLLAAGTAWDGLASELRSTAAAYASIIAELLSGWFGPSSTSMLAAAAPYIAWLESTAAQAEQTALQAKAAAGAFEAVFAATVPPPVVEANRVLLEWLVATNVLGQNTPAIATTEAQYAEMWAQDAGAMYGYAGASEVATRLAPFTAPPTTTNDAATADQSAAVAAAAESVAASNVESNVQAALSQSLAQAPAAVQSLAANAAAVEVPLGVKDITGILKTFNGFMTNFVAGPYNPLGIAGLFRNWYQVAISIPAVGTGIQGIGPLLHPKALSGVLAPLLHSDLLTGAGALHPAGAVAAAAGRAGTVGALSVPSSWASAVPAIRTVAAELPETMLEAAPAIAANDGMFAPTALSSLAGRAVGGTATRAVAPAVRVPGAVALDDIATTSTVIVIPPNAK
ncbi:PPE family protein [Mycobacterium sp. Aquia_213]|uniref:PPE family protein n=1 Tax=Mycobacterium sp. Aquia_213 TaxID=2991728 RepID=UPI00227176D6|nr:PPE family protein [Mycobacterium sp. Aquia_213]WAC90917.1 PPE family protein [Mycobacterium sp. Aquia_213]